MTIFGLVPSPAKYQVIDISVPIIITPYRLVVPWPKEMSRLLAPILPFQPMVGTFSLAVLINFEILTM